MAFMHGKNAKLFFRTGATMRDLSPYLTDAGMARKADVAEVSTLGTNDKNFLNGMREGTFALSGFFDPTVDGYLAGELGGTAEAFRYFPQGSATGRIYYSGSAILTDYSVDTSTGDAGKITGSLQASGPIARTVSP
jgi:hypothetical protein